MAYTEDSAAAPVSWARRPPGGMVRPTLELEPHRRQGDQQQVVGAGAAWPCPAGAITWPMDGQIGMKICF